MGDDEVKQPKKKKHRKKSKRKNRERTASPVATDTSKKTTHGGEDSDRSNREYNVQETKNPASPTDKGHRKRTRSSVDAKPVPKKKKSRKRKDYNHDSVVAAAEERDDSVLEGAMVTDHDQQQPIMVLVDKRNGVVYSTVLPLQADGSRPQIGVWKQGKIELFPKSSHVNIPGPSGDMMSFPFKTDSDDHCESPLEAYQDIVPLLQVAGCRDGGSGKKKALTIYDPYFCNGGVVRHLNQLGFPNVYNQMEDCYEVWKTPSRYPDFDVLVTNPPYSSDHIEQLMRHLTCGGGGKGESTSLFPSRRPWMLLLPQWVHKKDYYVEATKYIQPFYLVPHKRYVYVPPVSFRERKKSDTHKKSSPFVSMWYIWGGTVEQNSYWLELCTAAAAAARRRTGRDMDPSRSNTSTTSPGGGYDVARSRSALRDLRRKNR